MWYVINTWSDTRYVLYVKSSVGSFHFRERRRCLTVLSLQQLLDAGQYKYRFSVLRKLGVEEKHIGKLSLFKFRIDR